jgi:hypothetical protein
VFDASIAVAVLALNYSISPSIDFKKERVRDRFYRAIKEFSAGLRRPGCS